MPGPLLHIGATAQCSHGGSAQPTSSSPRVLLSGQPLAVAPAPYAVAGCMFNVSGSPCPCVTAQWVVTAVRVTSMGMPVLLMTGQAVTVPNGTPLIISSAQARVIGT